jgi:hypothetical protein
MPQLLYLHRNPEAGLPSLPAPQPSRVVLISEAPAPQSYKQEVAKQLVLGGCVYFMAWGRECEAWHDAVDMANLEQFDFKEIPEESFVMTTWHEKEPLSEVLWFCKNNAFHASVKLKRTVLLHLSSEPAEDQVLEQYRVAY